MFRKVVEYLISLYLKPLSIRKNLALYSKYKILEHSEHLVGSVHFINKNIKIKDGDIILDIGSYNGGTCKFFSNNFPDLKVYGFEPNPITYELAVANTKSIKNISIQNTALDIEIGQSDFYVSDNSKGISSSLNPMSENPQFRLEKKITVEKDTLDNFLSKIDFGRVLIMKLDTQGRELNIFKGGEKSLKKVKLIITEMNNNKNYKDACQYYEVDDFLRKNGFKLCNII